MYVYRQPLTTVQTGNMASKIVVPMLHLEGDLRDTESHSRAFALVCTSKA